MRRLLLPISLVVSIAASSALAAVMTGEITSVDTRKRQVVMEDGQIYQFPSGFDVSRFKSKQKVRIVYQTRSGRNQASSIFIVQ